MAKNIYITESQFRKILESAGDLEYHFTPLENLCGMMEDDALDLTDSDYEEGRNGLSFLSLSRLRSSAAGYGWGMTRLDNSTGPVARIEFDGRKLNNIRNVNVRPYNYFYNNIGRTWKGRENSGSDASEFEDSLTLKDGRDQIVDAIDYITRIDVYLSDYQPDPEIWQRFLDDLETYGDWAGKMHFYTDLNGFDYQRNEIPKSQIYGIYSGQMKQAIEEKKTIREGISHILPPYEQWKKNIDLDNMQRQSPFGKPRYIVGNNLVIDMSGHATEHLGHDLLEATLRRVDFNMVNKYGQIRQTILFPFNIGYWECVETDDNDKIIYARRGDRPRPSRIVLGREPKPCKYVQIVLQKMEQRPGKTLIPWKVLTAYVGREVAKLEPWDPRSDENAINYWKNHALISTYFDETSDEGDAEYWKKMDPKIDWAAKGQQYKKAVEENKKMGKNIYITESQLSKILAENGMIDEHIAVIDNSKDVEKLISMQWTSPDDYWFIQVTQRKKDFRNYNKRHGGNSKWWNRVQGVDGTSRENFAGYGVVKGNTLQDAIDCLHNIKIKLNPWAAQIIGQNEVKSNGGMEAIYDICDKLWARAYITINKRSMSRTQRIAQKGGLRAFEKESSRNHRDAQYYPWSMIDMDIDDPNAASDTDSALSKLKINPAIRHSSHDGTHYFFDNRDIMKYSEHSPEFSPIARKYAASKQPGEAFTMKEDAKMIIYSPCGQ